jgi:RNA polymerase sigma-70 factor (sigma-E family)
MTFEEFAAARLGAVLRFAAVLTGDRAAAEDVVQEMLIRALGRWEMIASLDRPEAYVRKMIVNEWLSWRRRSWRQVPSGTGTDVDTRLTPDPAVDHAERDALLAELARLPRRQRAVLVLRYYEALSDAEIAEVLGCAPGTVRGSGQTGCGYGDANTPAGTWSRFTAQVSSTSDVGARGIFNPPALVRGIATGRGGSWPAPDWTASRPSS